MLKKKTSSADKKRKHVQPEDKQDNRKRRSAESTVEGSKDELADPELDRIGSDIEEGGLDLAVEFQPITAYVSDKKEMLQQCFKVLGEKKLWKMLPDEFKDCSLEEIRKICWEQLEQVSEKNLLQILTGEELTSSKETSEEVMKSQQDNNVDSTSCLKDTTKTEDIKEAGVSGEESDVLSINADAYDSDIEAPKDEQTRKITDELNKAVPNDDHAVKPDPVLEQPAVTKPNQPKKDIQRDIDKSVSEILSFSAATAAGPVGPSVSQPHATGSEAIQSAPIPGAVCQPSIQQLELLELEMRARAIKALMKANKKTTT